MEQPKIDLPKLPDMVMCGDHPSFTKTELNIKLEKEEKSRDKTKCPSSFARISPSSSRTDRADSRAATRSDHALRLLEAARRRPRSLDAVPRTDAEHATTNRALVQAALGSFRWPPYLLCVWVVVLVLTHVLHCLVSLTERTLPNIKKCCQYFKQWTEESWKLEQDSRRIYPLALACLTGLMYSLYYTILMVYSVALWSIEPLCADLEETKSTTEVMETKVTNYIDEVNSKSKF